MPPHTATRRLLVKRDIELTSRLYQRGSASNSSKHVACVVQHAPRIDDVELTNGFRLRLENTQHLELRVDLRRERTQRRAGGFDRLRIDIESDDPRGTQPGCRQRVNAGAATDVEE